MFGFRLRRMGAALRSSRETLATSIEAAKGVCPRQAFSKSSEKKVFEDLDKVQETVS